MREVDQPHHQDSNDFERLVQVAIAGDESALVVILTETRQRLLCDVAIRTSSMYQAVISPDDVVQETHADVFRQIGDFEYRGEGSFYRWIATIAFRRLADAIRRQRAARRRGQHISKLPGGGGESSVQILDLLSGSVSTPSSIVGRDEVQRMLDSALVKLPDDYRHAVQALYVEGKPVRQIAEELGRTERAIHGLCRRGLKRLQRVIKCDSSG